MKEDPENPAGKCGQEPEEISETAAIGFRGSQIE